MAYCASISQNVRPHGKAFFRNQIFALAVVTTWNKSGVRSLGPLLPVLSFEVMPFVLISIFESVNAWSLLLGSSQRVFLCFLWTGRASLKRMIFEQILVTFHFLTKKKIKTHEVERISHCTNGARIAPKFHAGPCHLSFLLYHMTRRRRLTK
jgi:hypothetical protein